MGFENSQVITQTLLLFVVTWHIPEQLQEPDTYTAVPNRQPKHQFTLTSTYHSCGNPSQGHPPGRGAGGTLTCIGSCVAVAQSPHLCIPGGAEVPLAQGCPCLALLLHLPPRQVGPSHCAALERLVLCSEQGRTDSVSSLKALAPEAPLESRCHLLAPKAVSALPRTPSLV